MSEITPTPQQKEFQEEMEICFPGHFTFTIVPPQMYRDELTRYTYAGWRVGRQGTIDGLAPEPSVNK